jgi:DNA-directed RNA polymerase specialized sigma24 family protein
MDDHDWLAERFEENRVHLRTVAYRMLGSLPDADDAVQEAWMRLGLCPDKGPKTSMDSEAKGSPRTPW